MIPPTLSDLRRYAIARSLFKPTTLPKAIAKLGFVQADPIRAPARAQDLTLRHRVTGYRAGDLERRYPRLPIEEDFFVNYGFMPRALHALMHPRTARQAWTKARWRQAHAVLDFVREHGVVHPRDVDAHFAHGKVTNWFGGSSNASTQLLDGMHYRGLLRIARREGGIRLYAAREVNPRGASTPADPAATMDTLVDVIVNKYAPLPAPTLAQLVTHLKYAVPHWLERAQGGAGARQGPPASGHGRGSHLVLARRRGPAFAPPPRERRGAVVSAVRPRGLGPPSLRGLLGLGLSPRGVHAGAKTRARLLRAAADVGRRGHRLGESLRGRAGGSCRRSATSAAARRSHRRSGRHSTLSSRASRGFSASRIRVLGLYIRVAELTEVSQSPSQAACCGRSPTAR